MTREVHVSTRIEFVILLTLLGCTGADNTQERQRQLLEVARLQQETSVSVHALGSSEGAV